MPLEAQGYQIIGASIFGPEPLFGIHVDVRPGSTMLYGKNGTGKTRLLDQLTQAFRGLGQARKGSAPSTLIHTSLEVRPPQGDNNFVLALYEMLDVSRELQTEDDHREEFQAALLRRANTWAELDVDDPMALLDYTELRTSQGFHFSLAPSGTLTDPTWSVYVSAILGEESRQKIVSYGAALSNVNRLLAEETWPDDESWAANRPFPLAQAMEWYTEPFHIVRDGTTAAPRYLSTNSSPMEAWPAHIPVPLVKIGSISRGPAQVFVNSMPLEQIQQRTLSLVSSSAKRKASIVEASAGSEIALAESVQQAVALAEKESNRILDLLADFPFRLQFDTCSPSDWFAGNPPKWIASSANGEATKVSLDDLSFSEQKWVRFALSLVLSKSDHGKPRVVILDEPEQGLHRQLESRISMGLHRLVAEFDDVAIMGATHSLAFLDPRHGSNLLHVSLTGSGKTVVSALDVGVGQLSLDEESDRLGVTPSDILAMTRVAVIVEGTHDQIVLEECLSQDISQSGARVFVMRGTDNAVALPDMQFLFDALDAPIVVVLDNVVQLRVMPIWQRAVHAFRRKDPKLAERTLEELASRSATKEELALAELGRRAIKVGRLSRITPFGLEKPDILDYLSPKYFNLDSDDWQTYKTAFQARRPPLGSFKDFMRREYNAKINVSAVGKAAKGIDVVPEDFVALGSLIRELGYLGAIDDLEISDD
jgi:hypothetical protein